MAIKLMSKDGDMLPLLHRMEGEKAAYIENDKGMHDGLTPKVHNPIELNPSTEDTVIYDMVGAGESAEVLKEKGMHVVGGGVLNDKLELDRKFGLDFMNDHGIQIPPTEEFDNFERCKQYILKSNARFVFKPDGNQDTDLTYVPKTADELKAMMPYLESKVDMEGDFVLQEFVDGIELSTEAWFNGERFILPINSTMEEKKFMVGNVGPNTGCMGNVVWAWDDITSQFLYEYLFKPLEPTLEREGYCGPLDINGIWNEQGIHGLEWTARFGYDAIQAFSTLLDEPLEFVLSNLRTMQELPVKEGYQALAIRVSIPPFPSDGEVPQVPVILARKALPHVFLSDVKLDEEQGLVTAGTDGYVLTVARSGRTLPPLQRESYSLLETIQIPSMQYRVDIGDRVPADRKVIDSIFRRLMS